jgi:hypothetical protein
MNSQPCRALVNARTLINEKKMCLSALVRTDIDCNVTGNNKAISNLDKQKYGMRRNLPGPTFKIGTSRRPVFLLFCARLMRIHI